MMHTDRLKVLQKAVLAWPEGVELDMRFWRLHKAKGCGTAMCAGGLACTIPEFQACGLRLVEDEDGVSCPRLGDKLGYYALGEFFDLSREGAVHIFDRGSYEGGWPHRTRSDDPHPITPEMVARHIQDAIDGRPELND